MTLSQIHKTKDTKRVAITLNYVQLKSWIIYIPWIGNLSIKLSREHMVGTREVETISEFNIICKKEWGGEPK